jgi:type I restriction enzyme S subunit
MMVSRPLGAILKTTKGKKPKVLHGAPVPGLVPYIDISAVEHGTQRQWADPNEAKLVPAETLVMVWDGARSGWVGLTRFEGALGSTLAALDSPLNKRFLAAFLRRHFADINSNHRGSGIPHVNPDYLKALEIPMPSEPEQVAIVELLEAASEKSGSTRSHLAAARHATKRFRQSVIYAACSGRLTEDWRGAESRDESLPSTWSRDELNAVADIRHGFAFSSQRFHKEYDGPIVLTPGNFVPSGRLDFSNSRVVRHDDAHPAEWVLPKGELVVVMTDLAHKKLLLGIPALIETDELVLHNQRVGRVVPRDRRVTSQYLWVAMMSPRFKAKVDEGATGSVVSHTSPKKLGAITVPLPPVPEQQEIVRRVGQLLELADHVTRRIEVASTRIDRSSQAVLANTFRGELAGGGKRT